MKKLTTLFLSFFISLAIAQVPMGYYDGTAGLSGASLKTKLSEIISAGALDKGYESLMEAYVSTDSDHFYENDGTVLDMYSENPAGTDPYTYRHGLKKCGNYSVEGDCYNREHIIPQSFFGKRAPMVSDIHHIRPTDGKVNGMRSNYPFGTVANPSYLSKNGSKVGPSASAGFSGTVFEPVDEFKGDIARMVFYFVTRYENNLSTFTTGNILDGSAYPGLQKWELDVLLTWTAQDPVSPSEIERNNASYNYQQNRNPFIDHPEWVAKIWGSQVGDNEAPTAPTNLIVTAPSASSVDLSWTASTDNIAVSYYKIYVNGVFTLNATANTATVGSLMQGTTYTFYVIAVDAAGNISAQSNTATGTTITDTEKPSAPTDLAVTSVAPNNIGVSWTASIDNIGVTAYDLYLNGIFTGSTSATETNFANLEPSTQYSIYVVAKDAAGNRSAQSNTVTATTPAVGTTCASENFETIPKAASSYSTYNWTSNGISWTSEDSRTDLNLNGRAITIRNGFLTALSVPNGIGSLTVTTQLNFSGSAGTFKLFVNDVDTGKTIPYSATSTTTTIADINIAGPVKVTLVNTSSTNRVAIDDLSWTCYTTMGTGENFKKNKTFTISPNPVKNGEINVIGENLNRIEKANIYDFSGKLIQSINRPFLNSTKIILKSLPKGIYFLQTEGESSKFIIN